MKYANEALSRVLPILKQYAKEVDQGGSFPSESLKSLRDSGLMGLLVPREYGGMGGGLHDFVEISMQMSSACLSSAFIWTMHCQQVDALVKYGSQELQSEALPKIADGQIYIASVTSEAVKGGHLLSARAPLSDEGDFFAIHREAPIVTGGSHADAFLITMRSGADSEENAVSLLYADRADLQIVESGTWDAMGMRGTQSLSMSLDGRIPAANLIGAPGKFGEIALESMIPLGHIGWSACWLGAAKSSFSQLVKYLSESGRKGAKDLSSELLRERLGKIRLDLELVHAYLQRVCAEVADAREHAQTLNSSAMQIHINSLKLAASELTFRAVSRMVDLAGLHAGYSKGSSMDLERVFRDLRSASLNYSNDRLWTANGTLSFLDRSVRLA
ncbi:acyl-CoA dehydrogenase family protein [Streptomyces sp. NPDC092903]|uniref:acyl-CoA dehydrogenase family protein n=1 Tax=Streptomyces sp. NPDC092903 TaxID=3366017 RepID=UPI00382D535B